MKKYPRRVTIHGTDEHRGFEIDLEESEFNALRRLARDRAVTMGQLFQAMVFPDDLIKKAIREAGKK